MDNIYAMETQTFYDQYWENGLHVRGATWDEKRFKRVMAPLIGRERVLDYGCGIGHYYQKLLSNAVKSWGYAGVDVAPMVVTDLRRKGFDAYTIDSGNGAIDCPDETFDGATCIEVLEHLFDPLQAAKELHRILKPGGVLVATVPNFGYHPWRLMALLRAQVPSEPEDVKKNRFSGVHIRFFSKLMFKRLLRDAGFTDIKIGSFDDSSIWDVTRGMGHIAHVSDFARNHLPGFMHLRFLGDVWPNVCAMRLRAVAYRPA